MRAAFGGRHCVDFVHDHGFDVRQRRSSPRGEQQEQRFRRRDQDIGRGSLQPIPLAGWRISRPDSDRRFAKRMSFACGERPQSLQRRLEIPRDVDAERLERRDIQRVDSGRGGNLLSEGEPVDGDEERGERFAGARRGEKKRAGPAGDRLPGVPLGVGRTGKCFAEPPSDQRMEMFESRRFACRLFRRLAKRLAGRLPKSLTGRLCGGIPDRLAAGVAGHAGVRRRLWLWRAGAGVLTPLHRGFRGCRRSCRCAVLRSGR